MAMLDNMWNCCIVAMHAALLACPVHCACCHVHLVTWDTGCEGTPARRPQKHARRPQNTPEGHKKSAAGAHPAADGCVRLIGDGSTKG